ncbi:hypothetical protein K1Y78_34630 [Streptomyces sp. tea 10]|nr:hypothetical protein [Streptomyces sp. tea 10]
MKHVRRGLAAVASLALTAALCAVGTSTAAAAPPTSRATPQGHGTCTDTAPGSALQRQGAAWTCLRAEPASALAPAPVRAGNPGADLCTKDSSDPVVSTRKAYCTRHLVLYELLDDKQAVIGHADVMVVAASSMASLSGARWSEDVSAYVTEMTPNITGVTLSLSSACSGQCTAGPPAWGGAPVLLHSGQGKDGGTLTYTSTVGKGFHSQIQPTYRVDGTILGAAPRTTHTEWLGPEVRCDDEVGNSPGCIVMGHLADVTFSKSVYHGAAVAYEWAQKNLSGRFGDADHPLERFVDPLDPDNRNRRATTCDRGPLRFVRGATGVPNDSCDEYPFASTYQGGNDGALCVDITPRQIGGVWDVTGVTVDRGSPPNAPCIRAHVDNDDNKAAGGELGRAVQSDRILDSEWYQVIIVA